MTRKWILFVLTVFLANFGMTGMAYGRSAAAGKGLASSAASAAASRVPLYFETNQGQTDGKVRFLARAGGYTAFLTSHQAVLLFHNGMLGQKDGRDAVVRMGLSGSLESSEIRGGERLPGIVNYLIGNDPSKWHTQIPTYSEVHSDRVYPGVDLVYRASGKQLEFDFHVAAGANPDPIRMTYSGASKMELNAAGDLVLETEAGPASILKPVAYQDIDNKRVAVSASFAMLPGGEVGFRLGQYDHSRPLVIDPTVGPNVRYSTYLGSGSGDTFTSIAVDAAGEAFICGYTTATNYPTGAEPGHSPYIGTFPAHYTNNYSSAGFVTALNATGTGIIYSTYIAGSSATATTGVNLNAIAVNSAGNAFVGGWTDDPTFPTANAFRPTFPTVRSQGGNTGTGVVLELSPVGSGLVYSSFLGGGDFDRIFGIAIDGSNNAYVTGANQVTYYYTNPDSLNNYSGFPVTSGVIWGPVSQNNIGAGFTNGFVSKITPPSSGNATLSYSTLIESATTATFPQTQGMAIAVDSSGDAYVTGSTNCDVSDHGGTITTKLAMSKFAWSCNSSDYVDQSWVLELNPTATEAVYLAYLGGSKPNGTYSPSTSSVGVQVDSNGNAYVAGVTQASDFETTADAYQITPKLAGVTNSGSVQSDGFVTVIAAAGASFTYSTYLNGTNISAQAAADGYNGSPTVSGIALGTGGQFAVTGITTTTDFPVSGGSTTAPFLSTFPSGMDDAAFITKFTTSGLVYSKFLGAGDEAVSGIVNGLASNGSDMYVMMAEPANGLATSGAYDTDNSSGLKELVVRVSDAQAVPTTVSVDSKTTTFSASAQVLSLTSSVSASQTVNVGTVSYTVTNSSAVQIGSTVTSGTVSNGVAPATSFTLPASTPSGTYTITASYTGTGSFSDSSGTGTLVVSSPAATTTTVTSSLNPSTYGQSVAFTATVSSSAAAPTGTVQFAVDGVNLGTPVTLVAASGTSSTAASQATTTLSVAGSPHTVQANYLNADGNFSDSNGTLGETVNLATQATLTVTGVPATAQAYGATFTVGSSGGSGTGSVTFGTTGSCSVAGTTVTMTSGSGTCSVTATKAADGNYASATSAAATVGATLAAQAALTVTGVPATAQAYGATFTVGSSGGSGTGAVSFGATGSCSVSASTVTITSGSGTCSVTATKAADGNYASATSAAVTVGAALATQAALTVTGVPATAQAYGATFTVGSSGGSGTGAVTFNTTGSCSVSGTTVTMTSGSGTCSVTATKATDGNYASATSAAVTVGAALAAQATLTVTGVPSTAQAYGATFTVGSSGGNGTGAVSFGATGSCSVSGTTVTMTSGSGTCSVTATKASDGNYASATSAAATVGATLATQATLTVTGVPATAQAYGATFTVGSSGGSGTGLVSFGTTGSCSVAGTTVTMSSGTGTCSVTATKAVDGNYASATSAAATVGATLATQATLTVTGVPATAQAYGATFTVGSSGGSGTGAVTFNTTGSCSVAGTTVTMSSGTGTCSVTATKAADGNYASATSAAVTVGAALAAQATLTVTGVPATAQAYGATFTVGSSGGSGTGAVSFGATGSCSVSASTVTMTSGSGTCSVTATKAVDGNYASATSAAATVGATLAAQATLTVTGVPATAQAYGATFTVGSGGGSGTGAVTFSTSGSCSLSASTVMITSGSGTCSVTATKATDGNYTSATSAAVTVAVSKAVATVALASLTQTYTGSPLAATATTTPTGLTVTFTYNGSATAPTAAGSYAVVGTVNDPNYQGSAAGTLSIGQASLTITANSVAKVYGTANPVFSGSVTGEVTGDSFTESFATVAGISSPVGTYAIVPAATGANLSDYMQSIVNGTLTITQATTTTSLSTSSASITPGQSVTLTAQVASATSGVPTGTVSFYDGGTLLNLGTLNGGTATYTTAALAPGVTHTITATYSGDTNFTASSTTSSISVTVASLDFTLTVAGPASGIVIPGGIITYQVKVAPDFGSYAGTVDFAVSGLPPGATATFSPSSVAANGGQQTITVTIQTAVVTAAQHAPPPREGRNVAPLALALLLLFGAGRLRRNGRRLRKMFYVVVLLAGGAAGALLNGCGSNSGFFAQPPQSYNITITATSGNLQHTASVALNVE
jgi:hypothetical protein